MTITVTDEDIAKGIHCSDDSCPIARAIKRVVPNQKVSVGDEGVWIGTYFGDGFKLPQEARTFIHDWDHCKTVSPFTFEL